MTDDMELRTQQFIALRDKIKAMEAAHKDALKPWREAKEKVAARIAAFMTANNLENLKTAVGTCYTSHRTTASLSDPAIFMDYVITNKAFDLLDRRANSTAVETFVKKEGTLPPGCNLNTIETVGVRRAGSKDADD